MLNVDEPLLVQMLHDDNGFGVSFSLITLVTSGPCVCLQVGSTSCVPCGMPGGDGASMGSAAYKTSVSDDNCNVCPSGTKENGDKARHFQKFVCPWMRVGSEFC